MNRKLLFTCNPYAGKGEIRAHFLDLVDRFVKARFDVTVHTSQSAGELTDYIGQNADRYELLVSCGGDGTLNETISGLMRCASPPMLCYIPAGTVNDFASSLGIPKDMDKAGELAVSGIPFSCDIGRFGDRYFSYVAAFGAFTDVPYQTTQQSKQLLGRFAYIAEGIKRLPSLTPYHLRVSCDDAQVEGEFLYGMVSNSTSVAGLKLKEGFHILMNDGLFEVTLVRYPKTMQERQAILNGLLRQEAVDGLLAIFRTSHLTVTAVEAVPWTLDGEFGGDVTQVTIENIPGGITVLAPSGGGLLTGGTKEGKEEADYNRTRIGD